MNKIIYLDTNVFLHYQPFDQINWLDIVKADSATIVFPPITIRELNQHKDSHSRPQIRRRAGDAIKRLSGLLDSGPGAKINEKILVFFEDRDPAIDFAFYKLNPNVQDDHLIASIILNLQESPTDHIVLVTSDLGLTLLSKAGRQGINTLRLPENLRIADELDPNETKVKQLEQQIYDLNSRVPKLALTYEDGKQHAVFKLPKSAILEQTEVDEKLMELRNKFPKKGRKPKDETNLPKNSLEIAAGAMATSFMGMIPQEEFDRYNEEVEKYIPSYASYMAKSREFENLKRRTVQLNIVLANDGTTPAEDVDIYLHFPDGFQLLEEYKLPNAPKEPKPPTEPMTEMQRMANSISYASQFLVSNTPYTQSISVESPQNVSSPSIKRVQSYEVHVHVQKIKHNLQEHLDSLFVVFDTMDYANSFTIDYRILAANIPHEVTGNLHVVVKKDDHFKTEFI